jgi:hypothetical protein
MPLYDYACPMGHQQTIFLCLADHTERVSCACGHWASQIISAPLLVKAAQDVCYDSPIDGRPITNHQARQEDMKRNGCREYDPEQKTDYLRRIKEGQAQFDKSIDDTVEECIEKMPTRQRSRLASELIDQNITTEISRTTK